jgi:hypothetical protein
MRARFSAILTVAVGLGAWGAAGTDSLRAGEPLSPPELRETAVSRVCLVTARNGLGLARGYATGFLIGDGRFVLTDLATLVQPGVVQAQVRFEDGTTRTARRFGFAESVLGVAAIALDGDEPLRPGFVLAAEESPVDGSVAVTSAGWEWGATFKLARGHLIAGKAASALAAEAGCEPPAAQQAFMSVNGDGVGGASGSPVLDGQGNAVGIWLAIAGKGGPIDVVVPAAAVRQALLSAKPELKDFADLPASLWPARVQQMKGETPSPAALAQTVRTIRIQVLCKNCKGTGTIIVTRVVGRHKVGGMVQTDVRRDRETCPDCGGEGTVMDDSAYKVLTLLADQALRISLDSGVEERAREAARANVVNVLEAMGKLTGQSRRAFIDAAVKELGGGAGDSPRGFVTYAQVRETLTGPDGDYVVFAPLHSDRLLAARKDGLSVPSGDGQDPPAEQGPPVLSYGRWVVLAVVAEGAFDLEGREVVFVRPAAWVPGPSLGPPPSRERPPGESDPGRPPRREGDAPGFFGL